MLAMIILRLASGIREHFPQRVTEWIMTLPLLGWAGVLSSDESIFSAAPAFAELSRLATENTWAVICLAVGLARVAALVVNGTFREFRYSPHVRGIASLVACIFWGQITLGMFISWSMHNAVGTGFIAYSTFMAVEMWNLFKAWADVGASQQAEVKRHGHSD